MPSFPGDALSISARSAHPKLAARFLAWLYEVPQQRLLIGLGLPPVVTDSAVRTYWAEVAAKQPDLPRFQADGYLDTLSLLPVAHLNTSGTGVDAEYVIAFEGAFQRMYAGADVRAELAALQQRISQAHGAA